MKTTIRIAKIFYCITPAEGPGRPMERVDLFGRLLEPRETWPEELASVGAARRAAKEREVYDRRLNCGLYDRRAGERCPSDVLGRMKNYRQDPDQAEVVQLHHRYEAVRVASS